MIIIAVDPGSAGGACVFDSETMLVLKTARLPQIKRLRNGPDVDALATVFNQWVTIPYPLLDDPVGLVDLVMLEEPISLKQNSNMNTTKSMQYGFGILDVGMRGWFGPRRLESVLPRLWKRTLFGKGKTGKDVVDIIAWSEEIHPEADLIGNPPGRKFTSKSDGIADAIGIAHHAALKERLK